MSSLAPSTPTQYRSENRQLKPRKAVNCLCEIIDRHHGRPISGIIRNLSEDGAMIEVTAYTIPNRFILKSECCDIRRACEIVWRSDNLLGIRFVSNRQNKMAINKPRSRPHNMNSR